jgi:flagellar hook-associated protein 2
MATTSVSPASSSAGTLDVQSLVSQLMTLERQPIDKLNTKVSSYQTKISSFGTISGLVSGFQAALQGLNGSSSSSLQAFSATPSDSSVFSASAGTTAVAGNYTLNVTKLAQSQNLVATGQASSNSAISDGTATTVTFDFGTISGGTLTAGVYSGSTFTSNGSGSKSITIDGTNNTLEGMRDAINAAQMGITATIVNDGSGTPYRLAISSSSSGVSNSLKITTSGGDGTINTLLGYDPAGVQNLNQTIAAQNADFTVNGIAISKTSNTVTDAIQGVTLTLNKVTTTPVSLNVARDTSAVSKAAAGFVDAYNALVNQMKSRSAFGNATTPAGALAGDGTIRLMQDQLRSILTTPASGGTLTRLAQVGITFQTDGTLKVDSSALNSAMTNNFSDVSKLFSSATGFATRLDAWSTSVLTSGSGLISQHTTSLNGYIKNYNDQINKLEARMTILQKQYLTTYSNLNMLLSNMNSTSAYLTRQLG